MSTSDSSENTYIIDIESAAETARLIEQDKLFTQAMGGLFSEQTPETLASVKYLLDIACGPGGWVINVAHEYPHIEAMGVDINRTMIDYANATARSQGLYNASFEVMDAKKPLSFQSNSLDFINARFITGFMDQASWPVLIAECMRLLRPGGVLRISENEMGVSNSLASQTIQDYFYRILAAQKRTFSVDGHVTGITHMLGKLFGDAGFELVGQRPYVLDASSGADLHVVTCKDYEISLALIKPYLVASKMMEEAEFDRLYNTLLLNMLQDSFRSLLYGLTVWGFKPLA
ncbi:MAG: class I SAM-dependent methyltransferase [Chloroflexota bacterium]|nr:class I SAM-dependent methyltransferase [Chloroflexota bacterium]